MARRGGRRGIPCRCREPADRQHGPQSGWVHVSGAEPVNRRHQEDVERGADLSYDFVNCPAYVHALATGDTEFLRLTLNAALHHGLQLVRLVHALQNHDELTYELVHFATGHKDDIFSFRRAELIGGELAVKIRNELIERLTGEAAHNAVFTTNGIASTTATIVAAALGYPDVTTCARPRSGEHQTGPPALGHVQRLAARRVRVVRMGPMRMLTLERSKVPGLLVLGDTRWIHRAAYDLMDYRPEATESPSKTLRGASLYGSLPGQLKDLNSFAARLREILAVRTCHGIATSEQVDVPEVSNKAILVMVHRLDTMQIQVTVPNFSSRFHCRQGQVEASGTRQRGD